MNVKTLEQIVKSRRTVREFSDAMPEIEDIKIIAESAVYAPYGGATGIPLSELRKIFILKRGSEKMQKLEMLAVENVKKASKMINLIISVLPFLKKKMKPFAGRLKMISKEGIPALHEAAYLVIIAEKKGFPPVEKQSMSHALQNMWLTATEKGLAFQIVSAVGQLSKNKEFLNLLNLKKGIYAFECCAIGISKEKNNTAKSFDTDKFVTWID
jgi:Nitroreductase